MYFSFNSINPGTKPIPRTSPNPAIYAGLGEVGGGGSVGELGRSGDLHAVRKPFMFVICETGVSVTIVAGNLMPSLRICAKLLSPSIPFIPSTRLH